MKTITRVLILLASLLVLANCTRKEDKVATVNLEFPKTMSSFKNGAMSTQILGHLVVNITAPGMPSIIQSFDRCHDCATVTAAPSTVVIDVPQGDGRLFQALAVYMDEETHEMSFFYGDTVANITGSAASVNLVVSSLGAGASMISGNFGGRILNADGTGPSGEVLVKYYPEGKPGLIIEKSVMANGWFKLFALKGVAFRYELNAGNGVLQPLFGGQGITLDHPMFTPSDSVFKVTVPLHKRRNYSGDPNSATLKAEEPGVSIHGFWGPGATGKRICHDMSGTLDSMFRSSETDPNSTTTLTFSNSAPPSNLYAVDIQNIFYQGGLVSTNSSCTSGVNYEDKISVVGAQYDGNGSDGAMNMKVPFRGRAPGQYGMNPPLMTSLDGANIKVDGQLLPGTLQLFSGIRFFKYVGSDHSRFGFDHGDNLFPCHEALFKGFTDAGSGQFQSDGTFAVTTNATLAERDAGLVMGACLINPAGQLYANGGFLSHYMFSHLGNVNPGCTTNCGPQQPGPPAKLSLKMTEGIADQCMSSYLNVLDANNSMTNVTADTVVTLTSSLNNGNTGMPDILYFLSTDGSCSTAVSSVTVLSGQNYVPFRYKVNPADTGLANLDSLLTTASAASLTSDSKTSKLVPSGSMVDFEVYGPAERSNAGACKAVNIFAKNSSYGNVTGENGNVSLQLKNSNNVAATAAEALIFPSGACGAGTEITSVNLSGGQATVYVKMYLEDSFNLDATYTSVEGINFSRKFYMEAVPVGEATKIIFSRLSATSTSAYDYSGQCIGITVQSVNDSNSPIAVSGNFSPNFMFGGGNVNAFTDSTCTSNLASLNFTNESSKDFYVRPSITSGSSQVMLNISGSLQANQSGNYFSLFGNMAGFYIFPTYLQSTGGGVTISTGACTLITISLKTNSSSGTAITNYTGSAINMVVSFTPGTLGTNYDIYESDCSTPGSPNRSIAVGQSSVTVYVKAASGESGSVSGGLSITTVPPAFQIGNLGSPYTFGP